MNHSAHHATNRKAVVHFGERELAALNARAEAMSLNDANTWDEAVDWGVPDYKALRPIELRMLEGPEFD